MFVTFTLPLSSNTMEYSAFKRKKRKTSCNARHSYLWPCRCPLSWAPLMASSMLWQAENKFLMDQLKRIKCLCLLSQICLTSAVNKRHCHHALPPLLAVCPLLLLLYHWWRTEHQRVQWHLTAHGFVCTDISHGSSKTSLGCILWQSICIIRNMTIRPGIHGDFLLCNV